MEPNAERAFLEMARSRLVVHLPGQVRTCLDALNDQQIWWRANESSNAIGNLVLHCIGSTRYYIGHIVGERDFVRDRDGEFAERREIARAELQARLDLAVHEADEVLAAFDPGRLLERADRASQPSTFLQVIGMQLVHFATHAGQIVFATKLLKADALDDVWKRTPGG
ncbi:MAG: DUF664 domain-containing protein [Acidobacteria bacterium]|nr:DUF664 domain-containing protein [Acidobacteriota bacterium]